MTDTTKLKEALDRITQLKEEAQKAYDEALGKDEWPKEGDTYYIYCTEGRIVDLSWDNDSIDMGSLAIGNVFRTREEAERHVERLKVMQELKVMAKGNKFNHGQYNCSIVLDGIGDLSIAKCGTYQEYGTVYFETQEQAQAAIDKLGNRLLVLFD